MQKDHKLFDDMARLASGAAGGLLDVKREIEAMIASKMEQMLARMNLVRRDEFEVVKEMAAKAREEQEKLLQRIEALEKHK